MSLMGLALAGKCLWRFGRCHAFFGGVAKKLIAYGMALAPDSIFSEPRGVFWGCSGFKLAPCAALKLERQRLVQHPKVLAQPGAPLRAPQG